MEIVLKLAKIDGIGNATILAVQQYFRHLRAYCLAAKKGNHRTRVKNVDQRLALALRVIPLPRKEFIHRPRQSPRLSMNLMHPPLPLTL